jgi:hypothetical protein
MEKRIGTCGSCGGDVMGHRGGWMGINPPPPDQCRSCGAVVRGQSDMLAMGPTPRRPIPQGPSRPRTP